jgi:hypothetical protein
MNSSRVFSLVASLLVLIAIVIALIINGSPATLRLKRQDMRRVRDLNNISEGIENYYRRYEALPPTLDRLVAAPYTAGRLLRNRENLKLFEYVIKGPTDYQLCTTFALPATDVAQSPDDEFYGAFIPHGRGHQCIDFTITPTKKR